MVRIEVALKKKWRCYMKRIISKVIVCLMVFVITLFVSSSIYNKGNEEMTANMQQASLPLVHIMSKGSGQVGQLV